MSELAYIDHVTSGPIWDILERRRRYLTDLRSETSRARWPTPPKRITLRSKDGPAAVFLIALNGGKVEYWLDSVLSWQRYKNALEEAYQKG